ncbi:hypothetical protein [Catalinimonas niigatensis]|uniref:hypothetical protein n=1 Tax=Catalinimonas niigatensis TaxID=1397264 RepID=UPI0026664F1A|nr:hypothetical protein [Catalinimonas niigatensis]WPP48294.1 hypothetical protein PZB72_16605 [Catalinimonas niigatensis]
MKKTIIASCLSLCILCSCSQQQATVEGCYMGTVGQDSVFLSVQTQNGQASGQLTYQFYEKDQNRGTFEGRLTGDTLLLLDYTFMSEGVESERQVAYLLQNDGTLSEGYGEMEDQEGKMKFRNTDNLSFGDGFILQKADCDVFPQ